MDLSLNSNLTLHYTLIQCTYFNTQQRGILDIRTVH